MTAKENRRHEWAVRVADYKASGLTMSTWCAANQCTIHQLKYWLRKPNNVFSSNTLTPSTNWVPLTVSSPIPSNPTLVVRIGQACIEIRTGFDPRLLREVVHALEDSSC
jgi:hypothetical protein